MDNNILSHCKWECQYHIVFIPKYRKKVLYAKTQEDITPDCLFNMGGNPIGAKTLDLNRDFRLIAAQLDAIAEQFFGKQEIV